MSTVRTTSCPLLRARGGHASDARHRVLSDALGRVRVRAWILLAAMVLGVVACSSDRQSDHRESDDIRDSPPPEPISQAAERSGVAVALSLVSPNGLWDLDLASAADLPARLPGEVLHFVDGDSSVVVRTVTWTPGFDNRFGGSGDFGSKGRQAMFNGPGSYATECRRELLINLGDNRGIAIFGSGVDNETLKAFADDSSVDGSTLRVSAPSRWTPRGELRTGWITSPHGSRAYSDIGDGWSLVVTPSEQDALDSMLCTDLTPAHTGISGDTLVDMSPYERDVKSVEGARITVGMLDKTTAVAIAPGNPGRSLLLVDCCGELVPPFSPAELARLVADVDIASESEFSELRSKLIDDLIAVSRDAWIRALDERDADLLVEGRDDDAAWMATGLQTPVDERPNHPYICMVTVRSAGGRTPYPPNEQAPECLSAGRATGTIVPGVNQSADHVWGVVKDNIVAVEVEIEGVKHRVEAAATGLPSMPRVFFATISPVRQVDVNTSSYTRNYFVDGPIVLRAIDAAGEVAAELEWGSEECPINLPEKCEPLP